MYEKSIDKPEIKSIYKTTNATDKKCECGELLSYHWATQCSQCWRKANSCGSCGRVEKKCYECKIRRCNNSSCGSSIRFGDDLCEMCWS